MDLTKAKYIKDLLNQACLELGFSPIRVIDVQPLLQEEKRFLEWRHKGYAGSMSYLKRANPINARPEMLMANAKSLIIFTANYYTHPPQKPGSNYGRIANYATGLDYHKVLKKKNQKYI